MFIYMVVRYLDKIEKFITYTLYSCIHAINAVK